MIPDWVTRFIAITTKPGMLLSQLDSEIFASYHCAFITFLMLSVMLSDSTDYTAFRKCLC